MSIFTVATCPQYRPCHLILGAWVVGCSLAGASGCGSLAAQGMNAEGVRLYSEARYDDAIQEFHKALNNDPRNADGYYNLAATYHRMGTQTGNKAYLQQAEQYYRMCQDHDPDHCQCYRGLAVLLVQQGRSEEAFHSSQPGPTVNRRWPSRRSNSPGSTRSPATYRPQRAI